MTRRTRRLLRSLLVVATSVVLPLVALELGLRHLGGYGRTAVGEKSARFGWRYLPNQRGVFMNDTDRSAGINNLGFRDRDWPLDEGGSEVFRVAALGNSFTVGIGVASDQAWPRVLEGLLAERRAEGLDIAPPLVMNLAIPAYTVEQSFRVFTDVAAQWEPDVVLLPLHPMDVLPMKPSADEADYPLRRRLKRTAVFAWLSRLLELDKPRTDPASLEWLRTFDSLQRDPYSRDNYEHWVRAVGRIDELCRDVSDYGGRLVLFPLPIMERWAPPYWPSSETVFVQWLPGHREGHAGCELHFFERAEDFVAEQAVLSEAIRERGFLTTPKNTAGIDDSYPGSEDALYLEHDFAHFSPRGHRVLAGIVLEELEAHALGVR